MNPRGKAPRSGAPSARAATPCGSVIIKSTGSHTVTGVFTSDFFSAVGEIPIWAGRVATEPAALDVG